MSSNCVGDAVALTEGIGEGLREGLTEGEPDFIFDLSLRFEGRNEVGVTEGTGE